MKKVSFLTACLVTVFLDLNAQQIWFTDVPEWGNSWKNLSGKVAVNPQDYKVAGYIFVEEANGWWTKPSFANPTVPISNDSTFTLDFTTGGLDAYCTRIIVFLVPSGYAPPPANGSTELPSGLTGNFDFAVTSRPHGERLIHWNGINWIVKRSVNGLAVGPGPNVFSSAETQVYKDTDSCLHLTIKNNGNGQWLCSEVISDTSFGYGVYTFKVKSRVDNLDLNSVCGLFSWDDIAKYSQNTPDEFYREYDIEFSYWTDPSNDVGQYVVQPYANPGNMFRFPLGSEINTLHQWEWRKDTILFSSFTEDSTVITEFTYGGTDFHYPDKENTRINLWLFNGMAPLSEQEVILSGFEFKNLLPSPEDLVASDGDTLKITLTWNKEPNLYYGIYRSKNDDPLKATLLTHEWIQQDYFEDFAVDPGVIYYYWVRASDNIYGSNTTGYSSGFSAYDTGLAIDNTSSLNYYSPSDLQVIPNPNSGNFTLKIPCVFSGIYRILVHTSLGMAIYDQNFDFSGKNSIPVSLKNSCQGVYYLTLLGKKSKTTKKLVVIR